MPHFSQLFRPREFLSFKGENDKDKPEYWFTDISEKFLQFLGWVLVIRFFAVFALVRSFHIIVIVSACAALIAFMTRAYILRYKEHHGPMAIFVICEFFCLFTIAFVEGGIGSPVLFWLPVIPVVCFLMIPSISVLTVLSCISALVVLILSPTFFGLTSGIAPSNVGPWKFLIDMSGPIFSMAYLAWLYEKKTWQLISGIQEAKEDLTLYKNAIEASSEGIVITNPRLEDNPIIYVNKAYEEITGYSFEDSVGKNCRFLQANPSAEDVYILRESIKQRRSVSVTLENKKKSGELFFNRLTISPVFQEGELSYFVGVQRDITLERNISQIFEQSQRIAKMEGFVYRPYRNEVVWTSSRRRFRSSQSVEPTPFCQAFDFLEVKDLKPLREAFEKSVKTKEPFEIKIESYDSLGQKTYYIVRGEPDKDKHETVRVFGLVQEVTDLVHIQNKLKTMVLTLTDIVFILNRDGICLEVLCENESDLLAPKDEIVGRKMSEFLEDELGDVFHELIEQSIDQAKVKSIDYDLEIDGEKRYFSARIASTDGERAICTIKNITEERKILLALDQKRKESAQRTKMTALGEMAGGIAHEINNPLTIIGGHAYKIKKMLRERENFDFEMAEIYTQKVSDTVNRISKIIKTMRRFARDGSKDPMLEVDFQNILNDTIELCSQRFKSMDVLLHVDNQIPYGTKLLCREVEVGQVLLNLLNNSFDAIKEVQVKEENTNVFQHWIRITSFESGDEIVVKVSDSGAGVPKHAVSKLFEPFYTSKGAGVGTGLGLSISQSIMRQHKGDLWFEDNEEETSFAFKLTKAA